LQENIQIETSSSSAEEQIGDLKGRGWLRSSANDRRLAMD
jgi:hypothetical protein